jgi:hydroxypyruvate reductase
MHSLQVTPHKLLIGAFQAGVAAVKADALLPAHLPPRPKGRLIVAAFGKAAADMAAWVERHWPKDAPLVGLAITRHGHGATTQRIRVVEAGHPLPDANGLAAATELLELIRGASQEDRVLALISGGGSSLLTLPVEGLSLTDVQATVLALLRSGAPITSPTSTACASICLSPWGDGWPRPARPRSQPCCFQMSPATIPV